METNVNDDTYQIKTNVNKKLSKELGKHEITFDQDIIDWLPPKEHGLNNSNVIIPSQYISFIHNNNKSLDIDYFTIIKDDIRNFIPLDCYKLKYISSLSHDDKNEIINIFNECIKVIHKVI